MRAGRPVDSSRAACYVRRADGVAPPPACQRQVRRRSTAAPAMRAVSPRGAPTARASEAVMIPADPSPRHAAARVALLMALATAAACASRPDPDADTAGARSAPPVTSSPVNTPQTPAGGSADGPVAVRRLRAEPYAFAHSSGFADSARVIARDDATWAR